MAGSLLHGLGLRSNFIEGSDGWGTNVNDNFKKIDALTQIGINGLVSVLPVSAPLGTRYILTTTGEVCIWETGWVKYQPVHGMLAILPVDNEIYYYDSVAVDWILYVQDSDAGSLHFDFNKSAIQSIPNNTHTTVVYDAVNLNAGFTYNNLTGVLTSTVDGIVVINYNFSYSFTWSTGNLKSYISKNDSVTTDVYGLSSQTASGATGQSVIAMSGTAPINVSTGDTLRIKTFQSTGGAVNVFGAASGLDSRISTLTGFVLRKF